MIIKLKSNLYVGPKDIVPNFDTRKAMLQPPIVVQGVPMQFKMISPDDLQHCQEVVISILWNKDTQADAIPFFNFVL